VILLFKGEKKLETVQVLSVRLLLGAPSQIAGAPSN